jgi:SH3 domain protein
LTRYNDLKVLPEEIYDDYVYYTVIAADSLNMRSGPGVDYEKIGSVPSKAKVGAVADSGDWYLVYYDKSFGWVNSDYISDSPGAAPPATPSPTAAPTPSPAADEDSSDNPET